MIDLFWRSVMKVVITGGAGFVGLGLARQLLKRGTLTGPSGNQEPIETLLLFDQTVPESRPNDLDDRVEFVTGDISNRETVFNLINRGDISVFHLASVVSGGGEKDFDLAMRVNLHGALHVFEALRAQKGTPRLVFASTIAVFGGDTMPPVVSDDTKQTPQTTYGVTKSICELLINDYSRKGFFDGRAARLPTVIIRPGKPNAAASSFVSGVFREPLEGVDFVLPVAPETIMPVLGYRAIVDGIVALHEVPADRLGTDRAVGLPNLTVTAQDLIDALHRVAGHRSLGTISVKPDPFIEAICAGWAQDATFDRAIAIELPRETSIDEIVQYYIDDYLDG
jgi:nucleoside-diphosphate-sugar epimerase